MSSRQSHLTVTEKGGEMDVFVKREHRLVSTTAELRANCYVENAFLGRRTLHNVWSYQQFVAFGPQAFSAASPLVIFGGRRSIRDALASLPQLMLQPANGAGRVRVQREAHGIELDRAAGLGLGAGISAAKFALARGGSVLHVVKETAEVTAALDAAVVRARKKFTYVQLYDGPPQPGDFALPAVGALISGQALLQSLRANAGFP